MAALAIRDLAVEDVSQILDAVVLADTVGCLLDSVLVGPKGFEVTSAEAHQYQLSVTLSSSGSRNLSARRDWLKNE